MLLEFGLIEWLACSLHGLLGVVLNLALLERAILVDVNLVEKFIGDLSDILVGKGHLLPLGLRIYL